METKKKNAGRVRIRYANAKHHGGCGNSRAYYLDKIEQAVVTAGALHGDS